ncbi:21914_t:CDS:2, partial [Cetraspora pellucida]
MNPSDDIQKLLDEERIKFYNYSNFKDVKLVGCGGFGNVYRAVLENNELIVALKSFKSNNMTIKEIVNELKLHCKVDIHSNIIRLYGVTKNEDNIILDSMRYMFVLEYADGGTLRSYFQNHFKRLNWNDKLDFALQISKAVKFLHAENIVHRDLDDVEQHQLVLLISDIKNGVREKDIQGTSPAYIKIYKDCWQYDPDLRPDIQQVVSSLENIKNPENLEPTIESTDNIPDTFPDGESMQP